ncbi:uncharacterized protein LOC143291734 [Babylonia areolata]|uniref:uncharacterized protein LOC143291734 n=1 Tax=Babylonia areolata TaxID=304850 RepID=UPI003FD34C55
MSQPVLKQVLHLMQEDLNPAGESSKGKKHKTKNAMKLIKTSRKGVWKELRRLQKREQEHMKSKRDKRPDFKSSIEKYQEEQLVSKVKEKAASKPVVANPSHIKNAQKVLEFHLRHSGQMKQETEKKEEGTVFTDRDFDKFEQEYDFFN